MLKRTITGAFLVLAITFILFYSYIPAVIRVSAALLSLMASVELFRVTGKAASKRLAAGILAAVILLSVMEIPCYYAVMAVVYVAAVISFLYLMRTLDRHTEITSVDTAILCLIVTILFQSIPHLRAEENGLYYLIFGILISTATDVGAYLVGKAIGKHKLTPKVSPNKTIEGAVGGAIFAVVLALIYGKLLTRYRVSVRFGFLIVYAAVGSVLSQLGDLSMSAVKRICKVKDFGSLLPGHGGILDRFDSQLFAIPFVLLIVRGFGGFLG